MAAATEKVCAGPAFRRWKTTRLAPIAFDWPTDVSILTRAIVLADETISIAGPPDVIDEEETLAAFDQKATQKQLARQIKVYGREPVAVSTGGTKLGERKLDEVPVSVPGG